jgi:hypothetical protein
MSVTNLRNIPLNPSVEISLFVKASRLY